MPTTFRTHIYRGLLLWLSYILLATILTWPTVRHLTSHLPGDGGDDPAIAWNLWWVKHALLNEGQNPFQSDFMFYPIGINLAFYTLTALNAATALPLTLNLGVVTASNLHMFFSFVAGAYGTFLLTRFVLTTQQITALRSSASGRKPIKVVGQLAWISAAIAGAFYAFAGSNLFYVALGQFNIASSHWVPFAVLYLLRTHHRPRRLKNSLLAGLFLSLQAWAEMTYASFLLIFIGLYWFYWLLVKAIKRTDQWRTVTDHLRAGVVMGLTFTIGITPILAQMLPTMRVEGDFLVEGGGFATVFSADLLGFIIPTMHHPLLGGLISQSHITNFDKGQHIYIGFVLLGLMLVAIPTRFRQAGFSFWLVAAAAFALLSLGPIITVDGRSTSIDGPFIIMQNLPFFKGNRYPSRYSVMLLLTLSVIAAFGLAQLGRWAGRFGSVTSGTKRYLPLILITALFFFEHLLFPLPQSDMQVPAPYELLAADPEPFTILDIPFAWRNGFRITGAPTTQFMFGQFYQTSHQKRLLQGNTSRNPEFKFQYFTRAPIINSLLALETGQTLPPEQWQLDRAIAADVLRFFNIKYIIVRPNDSGNPRVTPQATIPYIEAVFAVDKIYADPEIIIYKVKDVVKDSGFPAGLHLDTTTPTAPLYFGEGWGLLTSGQPIAAQREEVRLLLPMAPARQQITLRLRLPDVGVTGTRPLYVELNGWRSGHQQISRVWQELTFELPPGIVRPGLNDVRLHFAEVTSLPASKPNTRVVDVTVLSAGEEVGDFGHIFVNGYEISPNRRGYNLALIHPDSSFEVANFDTHLNSSASAALANYIKTVSPAVLVALAVADEASANLTAEAVTAIQSIGATGDLRGCFRCSHAVISELRPPDGQVLEALNPLHPAGVTTGLGLTEPNVAAILDWIRLESPGS